MNKFRKVFVLIAGLLVLAVSQGNAAVAIGEQAPEFKAVDTTGGEQSLSAYKDKFIVLEWMNHECPFIKKHYGSGNMQSLQKKYTEKGVIWLSICSSAEGKQGYNSPEEANRLTGEKGASPTAVILDADGTIGRMYAAKTTPHMFIIDPQGVLIYQGAIDSVPGTDQAEIEGAENYVENVLESALSGNFMAFKPTKSYGCSVKY